MDGLLTCAKAFEDLLPVKYHIIIGRKGKSVDLTVSFEAVEFHHLVGLHKLHDLRLSRASREKVFSQILSGQITLEDIKKSRYFCNIQNRLEPFQKLEMLFDKNDLVFRYNRKLQALSLIEAEYLLSTPHEYTDVYIFLDKKDEAGNFSVDLFSKGGQRLHKRSGRLYSSEKRKDKHRHRNRTDPV